MDDQAEVPKLEVPNSEVGGRYTKLEGVSLNILESGRTIDNLIRVGKARVNSLKHAIRTDGTQYGEQYNIQLEDPRLDHHNRFHQRHVDKFANEGLKSFITAYVDKPEDIDIHLFTSKDALADISAFTMFSVLHDNTQLDYVAQNADAEEGDPKIHEKKAHGVGAAIQTLAFTKKYAEVNGLSFEEAWNVTAASATMMLRHDEPKNFDRTFSKNKEFSGEQVRSLKGEELLELFEQDKIRLYDLSPAQLIDIFKQSRGANDGYGFVASFESDYAEELKALSQNHKALLPDLSKDRETRLSHLTEIAYWADMADMVSPYTEQLTRTLNTQYSKQRSFSTFHDTESQSNKAEGEELVTDAKERNKKLVEDALKKIDMTHHGHFDSDDLRLCWEMINVNNISKDSLFKNVPMVKDFLKEHIIMGGFVLREMGARLMRGDYSVVEDIYNKRMTRYNKRVFELEEQLAKEGSENQINGVISRKFTGIQEERDSLITSLKEKHLSYTPQDQQNFQQLVNRVLDRLYEMYDVTTDEYWEYQAKVQELMPAKTLPFESDPIVANPLAVTDEALEHFAKANENNS